MGIGISKIDIYLIPVFDTKVRLKYSLISMPVVSILLFWGEGIFHFIYLSLSFIFLWFSCILHRMLLFFLCEIPNPGPTHS